MLDCSVGDSSWQPWRQRRRRSYQRAEGMNHKMDRKSQQGQRSRQRYPVFSQIHQSHVVDIELNSIAVDRDLRHEEAGAISIMKREKNTQARLIDGIEPFAQDILVRRDIIVARRRRRSTSGKPLDEAGADAVKLGDVMPRPAPVPMQLPEHRQAERPPAPLEVLDAPPQKILHRRSQDFSDPPEVLIGQTVDRRPSHIRVVYLFDTDVALEGNRPTESGKKRRTRLRRCNFL